jgi:hypothetical protein
MPRRQRFSMNACPRVQTGIVSIVFAHCVAPQRHAYTLPSMHACMYLDILRADSSTRYLFSPLTCQSITMSHANLNACMHACLDPALACIHACIRSLCTVLCVACNLAITYSHAFPPQVNRAHLAQQSSYSITTTSHLLRPRTDVSACYVLCWCAVRLASVT